MAKHVAAKPNCIFLTAVVLATVMYSPFALAKQRGHAVECRHSDPLVHLQQLSEASGVAVSRLNPRRIWVHNDSGAPTLVELNDRGVVTGRIRLIGITVANWEATAVGPCPSGSCLYLGDIGDNSAKRKTIAVYRLPEPNNASGEVSVHDVFHATYPDGPHDAEALLITPKGEMFVVTKGETGPISVYRFPRDMQPGTTVALTRVGSPRESGKSDAHDRITDGAASPNGSWVVLRSHRALYFYATSELTSGQWRERGRVDLSDLAEPQGEGVAFADDTTLYLVGEGGGKSKSGTFARLTCEF
jgi:hypothetical protein